VAKMFPVQTSAPTVGADHLLEVARLAATRNRKAMRQLVVAVGPAMLRAVRKVLGVWTADTEDVLQDAVEGLLHSLPGFKGECSVLHFACRVAILSALAARRRMDYRAQWTLDVPEAVDACIDVAATPAEDANANRRRETLAMLLDELPSAQAEVLVLHCALGFTVEEIADTENHPIETIRSRLRLAKLTLRTRISASRELAEILELGQ
jgi:RNA polymerase sigma factor (sigma-70 family)